MRQFFPNKKVFTYSQLKELYIKHPHTHLQDCPINILLYLLYHISLQLAIHLSFWCSSRHTHDFISFPESRVNDESILLFYRLRVEKLVSDLSSGSFHMCVTISSSCSYKIHALKQIALIKASSFIHSLVYFSVCAYSFLAKWAFCLSVYLTQALCIHLIFLCVQICFAFFFFNLSVICLKSCGVESLHPILLSVSLMQVSAQWILKSSNFVSKLSSKRSFSYCQSIIR